ncbi:MAG TPA: glycosyltransferase [Geobacterales bacterium]|nr:glycosyltransferase [Geobacterales bacterium]
MNQILRIAFLATDYDNLLGQHTVKGLSEYLAEKGVENYAIGLRNIFLARRMTANTTTSIIRDLFAKIYFIRILNKPRIFYEKTLLRNVLTNLKINFIIVSFLDSQNSFSIIDAAKYTNSKLILLDIESPYWTGGEDWANIARNSNLVLTAAKYGDLYWKKRGAKNIIFFPLFCDTRYFKPLNLDKRYDILFLGSYYKARAKDLDSFLIPLINKYNNKVSLVGSGWEINPNFKKATILPPVNWRLTSYFYNSAKICLNVHPKGVKELGGLNSRNFEVLGCKSFLLSDYNKGFDGLFENKKHLVIADSPKEMIELAEYYLDNEEELEKIAQQGYEEVMRAHTIEHRAKQLLGIISKLY